MKLYHSTTTPIIGEFKIKGNCGYGCYFAKKIKYSKTFGDITYSVNINPKNTLVINDNDVKQYKIFNINKEWFDKYISLGYDSIAWCRNGILTEFIVLNSIIIKSFELI